MNLRIRLESSVATLSDLFLAAESRYWEGVQLCADDHLGAGIYQLGFAVEMWLKYACLRYDGLTPASTWNQGAFRPAERFLRRAGHVVAPESWHSLRFWCTYLRARRDWHQRPLDVDLERSLVHRTNRLYGVWWVSMRYFPDQAVANDARRAFDDAGWFRSNVQKLWR